MAIRNILYSNDPALKKESRIVTDFGGRLHQLIDDMRDTLIDVNGAGLAAPQVGVLRRVVVVVDAKNIEDDFEAEDTETEDNLQETIIELVNPEIVETTGTQTGTEGCLSMPGQTGIVTRPQTVTIKAQDRHGNYFEMTRSGMTARAFCHEVDHLNGILFSSLADKLLTQEELDEYLSEMNQQDS
jgi:peptide deformylase